MRFERSRIAVFAAASVAAAALSYVAGRAHADGVPQTNALVYSGVLTDTAGLPAKGTHTFSLLLTSPPNAACTVPALKDFDVGPTAGVFQIPADNCVQFIHEHADVSMELNVDGTIITSKLTAVPFALEADRAARVPWTGIAGVPSAWTGKSLLTVVTDAGTSTISAGATIVCGTATASAGNMGGYRTVKLKCEQACSSLSAHLCGGTELVRSAELGDSHSGWFASGTPGTLWNGSINVSARDCLGYTSTADYGSSWNGAYAGNTTCGTTLPVLCCD